MGRSPILVGANLKKSLLLGAVFGVVAIPAAFAADAPMVMPVVDPVGGGYSGFIEMSVSGSTYDYWGDTYEPWTGFGGAAAMSYMIDDSMSVGVDLRAFSETEAYDNYYTAYGVQGALHLNLLNGQSSYGGFVGLHTTGGYEGEYADYNIYGGLEGKFAATENVLLSGNVGVVHQLDGYYEMGTIGFANAEVAFFPTENIKLSGGVGAIVGQFGDDDYETAKTLTYNVEAAYKFDDSPFSVFARVSGYQDYDYLDGYGGTTLSVGARFSFDGESLQSQAASVNTSPDLSTLSWLRMGGW